MVAQHVALVEARGARRGRHGDVAQRDRPRPIPPREVHQRRGRQRPVRQAPARAGAGDAGALTGPRRVASLVGQRDPRAVAGGVDAAPGEVAVAATAQAVAVGGAAVHLRGESEKRRTSR